MTLKPQLPDGWNNYRFDQMALNINERVLPADAEGLPYVGLEHLDSESLKIRRWGTPDEVEAQKLRFYPSDIIFGKRRFYQRKLAVAEVEGICSAHAMVLRAKSEVIDPLFLPFFMQSEAFFERAMAISVGSLSPTINWSALARQEFPIPHLDEQHRIAEILWAVEVAYENYLVAKSEGEKLRRLALKHYVLRGIGQHILKETPIGKIPEHWNFSRIGKAGMVTLGRQRAPQHHNGKFMRPYLRVANVFDGYLDLSDVLEMNFTPEEFEIFSLREGDILLNEGQSRELVGRSCIFRNEIEGCCFQNTLVRFRVGEGLLPEYAQVFFQYSYYEGIFSAIALQTTSIAHLGAGRFSKLYMPIPPIEEQRAIVKFIREVQSGIEAIQAHLTTLSNQKQGIIRDLLQITL